jgi:hypothetical protein
LEPVSIFQRAPLKKLAYRTSELHISQEVTTRAFSFNNKLKRVIEPLLAVAVLSVEEGNVSALIGLGGRRGGIPRRGVEPNRPAVSGLQRAIVCTRCDVVAVMHRPHGALYRNQLARSHLRRFKTVYNLDFLQKESLLSMILWIACLHTV